jgi:hypothetical protein
MSEPQQPPLGGGTNDRALDESLAETGPGVPTDAIGPGQLSVPEQIELAEGPEAEAMARRLREEADEHLRHRDQAGAP